MSHIFNINPLTLQLKDGDDDLINNVAQENDQDIDAIPAPIQVIYSELISILTKYRDKLQLEPEDQGFDQYKIVIVGKKYQKQIALRQLEYAIFRINSLFTIRQNQRNSYKSLNPEEDEQEYDLTQPWQKLPLVLAEIVLENEFIFDLVKSETLDWENNDRMYCGSPNQVDNGIGVLAGMLGSIINTKLIAAENQLVTQATQYHSQFNQGQSLYISGRFNRKCQTRLQQIASEETPEIILVFPGISLCYETRQQAMSVLDRPQAHDELSSPKGIVQLQIADNNVLALSMQKVTGNVEDAGIFMLYRAHLCIANIKILEKSPRVHNHLYRVKGALIYSPGNVQKLDSPTNQYEKELILVQDIDDEESEDAELIQKSKYEEEK